MEMNLNEMTCKVTKVKRKNKNILATANVTFKGDLKHYFTITGFTVWRSKFEKSQLNVTPPRNNTGFEYCYFEKSLWNKVKAKIIDEYDRVNIPIIGEE